MNVTPTIETALPEVETVPDKDLTDWALLREMSDDEVEVRASADPDAQPTDAGFWKDATVTLPPGKTRVLLDLDDDVLAWFKAKGRASSQRINDALRTFVERQQSRSQASEIAEPNAVYDTFDPDQEASD